MIEPGDRVVVDALGNLEIAVRRVCGEGEGSMDTLDPVTLVVVQNGLQQVASEMDLTFERAAFSPVISEGFDRSDGIYDRDTGDVIAQGELGLPIFVGVMQFTTRAVIAQGREVAPGDIFLVNDPYCGGTHLMDVKMVKPFFYRGQHWAWLANTGHWPDTGGSVPGGFSTRATEVQQEGLRLPPVKLFRAGVMDDDILQIVLANIRVPEERIGDIKAQVAALTVGERRLTALLDRYGADDGGRVHRGAAPALGADDARAHRQDPRRRLSSARPSSTRTASTPTPCAIRLTIRKEGSDLHFDFSESSPPCRGPLNSVIATTKAAVYLAIKHIFPDVPINAGCFEPLHIAEPARDVPVRPVPAAGLGLRGRGQLAHRRERLRHAGPRDSRRPLRGAGRHQRQLHARRLRPAQGAALHHVRLLRRRVRRLRRRDGLTNGCSTIGISKTQPAEVLEQHYPILFEQYALRERSGGAGRTRGGFGVDYTVRVRRGEALLSFLMDHGRFGPPGLFGGKDGAPNDVVVERAGTTYTLAALVEGRGHSRRRRRRRPRADAGRRRVRRPADARSRAGVPRRASGAI